MAAAAAGRRCARVRVRDRDPAHYPYAVRVEIGGMTCRNCRLRVENALNSEEGLWARVDLAAGSALVRSRHPLSEERLRLVIGREGYTVGAITPGVTAAQRKNALHAERRLIGKRW